jgi:hypothetical protein
MEFKGPFCVREGSNRDLRVCIGAPEEDTETERSHVSIRWYQSEILSINNRKRGGEIEYQ